MIFASLVTIPAVVGLWLVCLGRAFDPDRHIADRVISTYIAFSLGILWVATLVNS